jgi:predicted nucleic-acid-binding Zn-ribbon protein
MGREADAARNSRVANVAEYERTVGPTLKWRERDECPKCGSPPARFTAAYCAGMGADWPAARRKEWLEGNGCPTDGEHLHIACATCGYGWHEFTKDDPRNRTIEVAS